MKKIFVLLLALCLLLSLAACTNEPADAAATPTPVPTQDAQVQPTQEPTPEPEAEVTPEPSAAPEATAEPTPAPLAVTTDTLTKSVMAEDGTEVLLITCAYPVLSGGSSDMTLQLNEEFALAAQARLDGAETEYGQWALESYGSNPDYFMPFSMEFTVTVTYQDSDLLSYRLEALSFTGGAHPNYNFMGYTYDLATGKELTLGEVMGMSEEDAQAYVIKAFTDAINADPAMYYPGITESMTDVMGDLEFYRTQDGVAFGFAPYVIAPYAAGEQVLQYTFE